MKYLTISTGAELICLIVAVTTLPLAYRTHWRNMVLFMAIICIAELSGIYVKNRIPEVQSRNEWIYNLLLIFQAIFISGMFYSQLKIYFKAGRILMLEGILLTILYLAETWRHSILSFHQVTYTVMMVFISLYSLLYYYFLIRDTHYVNLWRNANFWWVTGIFIFSFGTTTSNVFYHHLAAKNTDMIKHLTIYIYNAFVPLLYGFWSYSFICKKWEIKTSQV